MSAHDLSEFFIQHKETGEGGEAEQDPFQNCETKHREHPWDQERCKAVAIHAEERKEAEFLSALVGVLPGHAQLDHAEECQRHHE